MLAHPERENLNNYAKTDVQLYGWDGSKWVAVTVDGDGLFSGKAYAWDASTLSFVPVNVNSAGDLKVSLDSEAVNVRLLDELGIAYGVRHLENRPITVSVPYLHEVGEGCINGSCPWVKTGFNGDIDIGTEHLWTVGGTYVRPTVGIQMEVVSDSVEDDPDKGAGVPGTGIHAVTLGYLDANYVAKTEDIATNGTTPVLTTATDIFRVNSFRAKTIGTNGAAVGNVNIKAVAPTDTIYSQIAIGDRRARNIQWTVPAGKTLMIHSVMVSSGGINKTEAYAVKFTTRANYDPVNARALGFMMGFTELLVEDSSHSIILEPPTKLIEKTDIEVIGQAYSNNCICMCVLRGVLKDN